MNLFVPGGVRQKPHYYPNKAHFIFLAGEQNSSICRSKAIFRTTLKALSVLILFSELAAVSKGDGYAQDAADVARIMRAIQTRHVYLHQIYHSGPIDYIQWPPIDCGRTEQCPTCSVEHLNFKTLPGMQVSWPEA